MQVALPWSSAVDVSYVGQKSTHQLNGEVGRGFVNINAIDFGTTFLPENQDPTLAATAVPGATAYPSNLLRPFYGYNNIDEQWQEFYRISHSIQSSFIRRFNQGVQAGFNYTLTLKDEGTSGIGSGFNGVGAGLRLQHNPDGSFFVRPDQAAFDELNKNQGLRRHIVKAHFVWDLPDVPSSSGILTRSLAAIVNDWALSGAFTGGSTLPYTITYSYLTGGAPVNLTGSPDYNAMVRIIGDPGKGCASNRYAQFNTAAFAGPVAPSLGLESGRNYMQGCPENSTDLAIARNFRLGGTARRPGESGAVQRVQYRRVQQPRDAAAAGQPDRSDRPQPAVPAGRHARSGRVQPRNAGFGAVTGANPMRSIQATLRFSF